MGSEDNANLVRRGYAAFSTGDMATLTELIADDAVWHVPARSTGEMPSWRSSVS
ncbi:MAG TPA: nuclear transport factor 2 family protein [Streptosporangiaceae bacterium]